MSALAAGAARAVTAPPPASRAARTRSAFGLFELLMLPAGTLVNVGAYASGQPVLAALLFLVAGLAIVTLARAGGPFERRILLRTFAVGWFMAGIAAIYANQFRDPAQLYLDAGAFFNATATGETERLTFLQIQLLYENALPIVMWREVYNFMAALGFERQRFIGVLVNVLAVGLSGVLAIRMTRRMYGEGEARLRLMVVFFSCCGLFWLFAAVHIRDSMALLAVTTLTAVWIGFLERPTLGLRLVWVALASVLGTAFLGFLRTEFVFVPGALGSAGTAALLIGRNTRSSRVVAYALAAGAFAAVAALVVLYGDAIGNALSSGDEGYSEQSAAESSADSLGMKVIYGQPLPIRLVVGSIYLFTFPVPFWSGFQLQSAYHLFKSLNVLFLYGFVPMLLVGLGRLWRQGRRSPPSQLFVLFVTLGFTVAIAGSSLENRHWGAFLVSIFLLALVADPADPAVRRRYRTMLTVMLCGVVAVHGLWLIAKGM